MEKDMILVVDCGSTKIGALAIDSKGKVVASRSVPNASTPQKGRPDWVIWDFEALWRKITMVTRPVMKKIDRERLRAVIPVTWGADGGLLDRKGRLLYPIISWQCPRTRKTAEEILKRKSAWEIYRITGYPVIPFNTLVRLIWYRRHYGRLLGRAYRMVHMAGLVGLKLTGEMSIERTLGSTGMHMDLAKNDWSREMLKLANVDENIFPKWSLSWDVIGHVLPSASRETGIPANTPVCAGGHDTQFAAVGSGTETGEMLLSSGTWEVLMTRARSFTPSREALASGIVWEIAAEPGLYDPQMLMMGSAVLEWIGRYFYGSLRGKESLYRAMIEEGGTVTSGAKGLFIVPAFVQGSGPSRKWSSAGSILGLSLTTTRAQVYRAALEGLSFQLRQALESLATCTGLRPKAVRVVGGGSKNPLWNQIRSDVTGLPIRTIEETQATALGAAIAGFVGTGYYASVEEAKKAIRWPGRTIFPSKAQASYEQLFRKYSLIPTSLKRFYESPYQDAT